MSELTKVRRTTTVRVCDLLDLILTCIEFKNPVLAEFMIDLLPKIGKVDIEEFFDEMVMTKNSKDDIEENLFFIQEMLEKVGKWDYGN